MIFLMYRLLLRVSLVAALTLISSLTFAQTKAANTVTGANFIVALVDSTPITNYDVNLRASQALKLFNEQKKAVPDRAVLLKTSLERLVLEKALLSFAKETGVNVDDAAVNEAEQRLAAQSQMNVENFHKKVKSEGTSVERFRQDLRDQITLQRLTDRNVPNRIKISDIEVQQAIRDRINAAPDKNPEIELGHIFIAVSEKASDAEVASLLNKAQTALARVLRGDDFGRVAKEFSDGPERDKGGLMGLRAADRYPTLFVEATKALAVGDVAQPIRSGAGFHILKLVNKRSSNVVTVTETRARHILLRPGGQLSATVARAQLTEFKRQIEAGKADFAKLAQEHSQDASAQGGGDLGWVAPGAFVPEFEEVMNQLQPNQIADPVTSRFGVHLIQVMARREAPISERELREITRNKLRDLKFEETYQLWAQEIRGRAYIEYRDSPQ